MKTVLIVDDHAVVRHGLDLALEAHGYQVVSQAGSVNEARAYLAHTNPHIVIIDINLPDGSGFDVISWARKISPSIIIVALSLHDGADYVRAAKMAGANAYVVKDSSLTEILAAIDFAIASPDSFSSKLASASFIETGLTAREIDVLQSINHGLSNYEIATTLFISISTVKTHVSSILRKLEANNRVEALTIARERGLLV